MTDDLESRYGAFFIEGLKLRRKAGETTDRNLLETEIPSELRPLLPYAAFWGIPDDTFRIELVQVAPEHLWKEFRDFVSLHEDALLDCLAGPEAKRSPPSPEYLAFSFMLQASDWPRE
jgi:hypothetical protein